MKKVECKTSSIKFLGRLVQQTKTFVLIDWSATVVSK